MKKSSSGQKPLSQERRFAICKIDNRLIEQPLAIRPAPANSALALTAVLPATMDRQTP
jgi:hypothetical protein